MNYWVTIFFLVDTVLVHSQDRYRVRSGQRPHNKENRHEPDSKTGFQYEKFANNLFSILKLLQYSSETAQKIDTIGIWLFSTLT